MTRAVIVALAAAALVPAAAAAQYGTVPDGPLWGDRVRVTPFAGVAPRVTRSESWRVVLDDQPFNWEADVDLGAGPAAGVEVEVRVYERFSVVGSAFMISRGEAFELDPATNDFVPRAGSDFLVAKLGAAMRLREGVSDLQLRRLTATVFAAPALIREMPAEEAGAAVSGRTAMNMLGANVGVNAELPLNWHGLAFQLGLEDFLVFWNESGLAHRSDVAYAREGLLVQSTVDAQASHMVVLRAGVSLSFH